MLRYTEGIYVPQSEHAHLAGNVADMLLAKFPDGELDIINSMRIAVRMHDHVHGQLDTNDILGSERKMPIEAQTKLYDAVIGSTFAGDMITIMVKNHWRRLAMKKEPLHKYGNELATQVQRLTGYTGYAADVYDRLDTVMDFADGASMRFCAGLSGEHNGRVILGINDPQTYDSTYIISPSRIRVAGIGPLAGDEYDTSVMGYENRYYPKPIAPRIIDVTVQFS